MLKVSAIYLEKQKSIIPEKKNLDRCQYQNKKALFTDSIFSEGFENLLLLEDENAKSTNILHFATK